MAGLMVFLFIAIIYAKDADATTAVTEVVTEWQQLEEDIYNAWKVVGKDLEKWNAEIEKIH